MPPVIKRQRTISGRAPVERAPSGLGTDVGRAVSGAGRAVGDIGSALLQRKERQQAQDRKNKSTSIETAYDDEQRAYFANESQRTGSDSFGNVERAEKFRKESIERFTKDITDQTLKAEIEGYIQSRSGGMMDSLSRHQLGQRQEVSNQIRGQKIGGILKDSFDGTEPVEESLLRWEETIRGQRDTGQISEEEAVDIIVDGQQQIATASLDGIVNRNPTAAIELIKDGAYDQYLSQKQIKAFDKEAKALQEAEEKDAKSKATEREKAEKDALKEKQREVGNLFVTGIADGSLTNEQILKSVLEPTGENSKEHWLKEREKLDKKIAKSVDEEWKTKPEVEADLTTRIAENPGGVKDSDITDKLGKGLDNATATKLLNFKTRRIKGEVDPVKEQEEKTAIKRLSDAKSSKFFDPADRVNNSKLWAENVNNLQRYIINHPEEDLGLYVDQILEPVEVSFVQNLMDIVSFGQPGKEEATAARQEELRIEAEGVGGDQRAQAIQLLKDNGKPTTDANIDFVMEKL